MSIVDKELERYGVTVMDWIKLARDLEAHCEALAYATEMRLPQDSDGGTWSAALERWQKFKLERG